MTGRRRMLAAHADLARKTEEELGERGVLRLLQDERGETGIKVRGIGKSSREAYAGSGSGQAAAADMTDGAIAG